MIIVFCRGLVSMQSFLLIWAMETSHYYPANAIAHQRARWQMFKIQVLLQNYCERVPLLA
jgi:hypothetical protein